MGRRVVGRGGESGSEGTGKSYVQQVQELLARLTFERDAEGRYRLDAPAAVTLSRSLDEAGLQRFVQEMFLASNSGVDFVGGANQDSDLLAAALVFANKLRASPWVVDELAAAFAPHGIPRKAFVDFSQKPLSEAKLANDALVFAFTQQLKLSGR